MVFTKSESQVGKELNSTIEVSPGEAEQLLIKTSIERYAKKKVTPLPKIDMTERVGPPMAYGYGRVSTDGQYEGDSVPAQERRAQMYYEMYLKKDGVKWGGFCDDGKGTSATKIPLMERKGGAELMRKLRPGDHIIFDKIDRMWRKVGDFCRITEWFAEHNITMHIVNMGGTSINTSSYVGKILLTMLACFAEAEAAMTGQRIRDAIHSKKLMGESKRIAYGTKVVSRGNGNALVWDVEKRLMMQRIVELRDKHYYNFVEIAVLFENERRIREGLEPMNHFVEKRYLTTTRKAMLARPYYMEKAIQVLGITDPAAMHPTGKMVDIGHKYNRIHQKNWEQERIVALAGRKSMPTNPLEMKKVPA